MPDEDIVFCTMDLFDNVISLTSSKDLYLNQTLYSKNIEYVLKFNDEIIYFIHSDNTIEEYSSTNRYGYKAWKCKKVFYSDRYFIFLENSGGVTIFIKPIEISSDVTCNEILTLGLRDVDDIELVEHDEESFFIDEYGLLYLYKNKEKIGIPLCIFKKML